jgi:DNA-binding NarL/FixJ family response regulator
MPRLIIDKRNELMRFVPVPEKHVPYRSRRAKPIIRILIVDDYEPLRRVVRSILQPRNDLQIVGEASDGLEAVQKAKALRPDLVLLDIALPTLNGLQVARRLCDVVPRPKILFLSVESSEDVVREAFNVGGTGYVYKLQVGSELLPAIETVLGGKQFVGGGLKDEFSKDTALPVPRNHEMLIYSDDAVLRGNRFFSKLTDAPEQRAPNRHEVLFYPDDAAFLDSGTRFVAGALEAGDVPAVVATESHWDSLFHRLNAEGLDVDAEIKHGRYISLDVAKTLSTFMVNDMPDWERFVEVVGGLVSGAAKAGKGEHPRVAIYGECGPLLWAEGKVDAAIQLEQFLNQLATIYEFDLLCAYALSSFHPEEDDSAFKNICAEHSAVSFR